MERSGHRWLVEPPVKQLRKAWPHSLSRENLVPLKEEEEVVVVQVLLERGVVWEPLLAEVVAGQEEPGPHRERWEEREERLLLKVGAKVAAA